MNDFLLQHAIRNVWCNPAQDRQYAIKLARLTPRFGVKVNYNLPYEKVVLPTNTDQYHVYQVGKVIPRNFGLPSTQYQWMTFAELSNQFLVMSDLYVENGFQFPRFESYFMITRGQNMIVAVKINERIHNLDTEDLYLRLYTNAYYQSARSDGRRIMFVNGKRVQSATDLQALQIEHMNLKTLHGGHQYFYVNGRFCNDISVVTAKAGDVVEYVHDLSIKRMVEFSVNELDTFHSLLDNQTKYLLHYEGDGNHVIDYADDCDLYLIKPSAGGRFQGVKYHQNDAKWLRMVTHRDYSIPTTKVESYVPLHLDDLRYLDDATRWPQDHWNNVNQLKIRMYIRESGYSRPLVADANRIMELYKLDDERVVKALLGVDGAIELWHAQSLENSPYVRFMSATPSEVYPIAFNLDGETSPGKEEMLNRVGNVYGYHSAAVILANTPTRTDRTPTPMAQLSYEHRKDVTVFEYDEDGVMVDWRYQAAGGVYLCRSDAAATIEAVSGLGSSKMGDHFGKGTVNVPYGQTARLYVTGFWRNNPTDEWQDITEVNNQSSYGYWVSNSDGSRTWNWTLDIDQYGLVRIDNQFLCRDFDVYLSDGQLKFSVSSDETHDGVTTHRTMEVPPGELDIAINGRWMIRGLDYSVIWPQVVVHNKEYLDDTVDAQRITLRASGFCTKDLELPDPKEWGYVEYGVLSGNDRYDVHDNKVRRVVIDGHYIHPDELVFDEDLGSLTIDIERNGAPYVIKEPMSVLRDVYTDDKVAWREDQARDRQVADYMDLYYPTNTHAIADVIETPYLLVSTLSNKILRDLVDGILDPPGMYARYSDQDIHDWLQPYSWLVDHDPCNQDLDPVRVKILPHWKDTAIMLNIYQYKLYTRALGLFLRNVPDYAQFVTINA